MDKMKAYVRTDAKSDRVALKEVPIPLINEDEVLIKVVAFGVGIHDRYFLPQNVSFPFPIGIEGSGTIIKAGANVKDFQIDDRVIFSSSMQPKGGCWAEYVAVSASSIVHLPDQIDDTIGAVLPVAGKTALESMNALNLAKGDSLFIAGASGAIGTLVIQLAKNEGFRVIASASSKNHDYMKSLGAEKAVDYTDPNWKTSVKEWKPGGVDAALAIQPGTGADSRDVVKSGGEVITVSGDQVEPDGDVTVRQFQHQLKLDESLGKLMQDMDDDKIQIVIEQVYPFEDAIKALEKTETRHARGKLVVTM